MSVLQKNSNEKATWPAGYEVRAQLGHGGMGQVFEATRCSDGTRVAMKFLHPELAHDVEMGRRFHREASILRSIDHPGVVRVIDTGMSGRGPFTAMEFLEGETLEARIERGVLSPAETQVLLASLADTVDAVHEHGVIHGDIKPANVYLLGEGKTKLVDFGTSKVHGLERLTQTGEISGTPVFMAPELITGDRGIDESIDIYALGVLAYMAICGKHPFSERHPGRLLMQIVMGEGLPLSDHCDVPPRLDKAIMQAMSRTRDDRYRSGNAFVNAFKSAI